MTLPSFSEDDRFQIEFTAQQTERRNRSLRLVVLGSMVFVVCALVWVWGSSSKASAMRDLRAEQRDQVNIEMKLAQIESLRAQGIDESARGEPITGMGTRLQDIAVAAGVADPIPIPDETTDNVAGGRIKQYHYQDVTSPTLEPLLVWMRKATDKDQGIDGLEVISLTIAPEPNRKEWTVDVSFRRWERSP